MSGKKWYVKQICNRSYFFIDKWSDHGMVSHSPTVRLYLLGIKPMFFHCADRSGVFGYSGADSETHHLSIDLSQAMIPS